MSGLTGDQSKIGMEHDACALRARHRSLRRVTADKIPLLAPSFSCVFLHPVRSSQETGASARGRVLKVALNFLESRARGVSVFVLTRRARIQHSVPTRKCGANKRPLRSFLHLTSR